MPTSSNWKTVAPGRLDLNEAAKDIIPGSSCSVLRFHVSIRVAGSSPTKVTVSSIIDMVQRGLLWAVAIAPIIFLMVGDRIGLDVMCFGCIGVGVIAGFLKSNIDNHFASLVTQGIKKSKAAVYKGKMLRETLALFATLRYLRPMCSKRTNYMVGWNIMKRLSHFIQRLLDRDVEDDYEFDDNNMDDYALRPLQDALIVLSTIDETTHKDNWAKKDFFEKQLSLVQDKLPELESVWLRNVAIPCYLAVRIGAIGFAGFLCWIAYIAIMTFL